VITTIAACLPTAWRGGVRSALAFQAHALEARLIENEATAQSFAGTPGIASALADSRLPTLPLFMYRYYFEEHGLASEKDKKPIGTPHVVTPRLDRTRTPPSMHQP
jgi:hypothetical protein